MDEKKNFNLDDYEGRIRNAVISDGVITQIELLEEHIPEPVYGFEFPLVPQCMRVCMSLKPTEESDIHVEVWLPIDEWNGNFLGTGNGGYAGSIDKLALMNGASRGYAVANTDMGTSPIPDDLIGKPERWVDFGYRATHLMTIAAKQLIEAFYGRAPRYSYFCGGSTGGQQGLMEAQRYPQDYNGIVAIAPANNRVNLHTAFVWNWQALASDANARIGQKEADAISECVIRNCQGSSGSDGFFSHPGELSVDMEIFETLIEEGILKREQADALKKIYAGAVDSETGTRIFVPWVPGCENINLGIVQQSEKEQFEKDFFYLFRWIFGKYFDFMKFDFHKDYLAACEQLAPILNATDADLSAFQNAGGKLLMVSGTADPIIPYTDAMHYYERVVQMHGGAEKTMGFFRYFLMPGLGHVFGGPLIKEIGMLGLAKVPRDKEHDVIAAIAAWVENGETPKRMKPVIFEDGNMSKGVADERKVDVYQPYIG